MHAAYFRGDQIKLVYTALALICTSVFAADFKPFYRSDAKSCPVPDELNHYVSVDVIPELKNGAHVENIPGLNLHEDLRTATAGQKMKIYFELAKPFDPKKEILILVPGGPGGDHQILHTFESMLPRLDRFNVIAMDHRGLGCSRPEAPFDIPVQAYKMRFAAADIDAIRVALGGRDAKINLLGGSYGTMLGQTYALLYPDNLKHLILRSAFAAADDFNEANRDYVSTMTKGNPALAADFAELRRLSPDLVYKFLDFSQQKMYSYYGRTIYIPEKMGEVLPLARQGEFKKAAELLNTVPWVMGPMTRAIACQEIFHAPANDGEYYQIHAQFEACSEFAPFYDHFNYYSSLGKIRARTLILGGEYDHVTPAKAMRQMTKFLPDVFTYIDGDVGHNVFEKRECAENLVAEFLNEASDLTLNGITQSEACTKPPPPPPKIEN